MGLVYRNHLHFWNIVSKYTLQGLTSRQRKSCLDKWHLLFWNASELFQSLASDLKIIYRSDSIRKIDHLVSILPLVISLTLAWNALHSFSLAFSPRARLYQSTILGSKAGFIISRKTSVAVSNIMSDRNCSSSVSLSILPILKIKSQILETQRQKIPFEDNSPLESSEHK